MKSTENPTTTAFPGDLSSKERGSNDLIQQSNTSVKEEVVLPDFLLEFQDVCREREAGVLPPLRNGIDLEVKLKDPSLMSTLALKFQRMAFLW